MIRLFNKTSRKVLKLLFGFDKWHISPLEERPYAIEIIRYSNSLPQRNFFAEIGCGLGDIIRNVDFSNRKGYDMDKNVLKAAACLPVKGSRKNLSFGEFKFPESQLEGTLNVLTLVNWIHHIEPQVLQQKLHEYFNENLLPAGEIIIDTVQDPDYKHNHQITFLTKGLNCSLYRIGEYTRHREVWSIKKI